MPRSHGGANERCCACLQECHHEFFGHTQISAGQQANLEALHGMTNMLGLMERAFAGFDKLVELNLQLISSSLYGSSYCAKMMLAVNRPQDVFEMQSAYCSWLADRRCFTGRICLRCLRIPDCEVLQSADLDWRGGVGGSAVPPERHERSMTPCVSGRWAKSMDYPRARTRWPRPACIG